MTLRLLGPAVLSVLLVLFASGCQAVSDAVLSTGCSVAHNEGVEWTNRPTIDADKIMRASGTLKEGYTLARPGTVAAFNFNNHLELNEERQGRLQRLGSIGPTSPRYDYQATRFDVDAQGFDIAVPIPERLESDDIKLVFVVWQSDGTDIAAACVEYA